MGPSWSQAARLPPQNATHTCHRREKGAIMSGQKHADVAVDATEYADPREEGRPQVAVLINGRCAVGFSQDGILEFNSLRRERS